MDPAIEKAAALARRATAELAAGNGDLAIATLREERTVMATAGLAQLPADLLRLPLYLQRLGRSAEAWGEFEALLLRFDGSSDDRTAALWGLAHTHDKIRLFLQREGRPRLAACYSVAEYLYQAGAQHAAAARSADPAACRRMAQEGLAALATPQLIEESLAKPLNRVALSDRLPALVPWVQGVIESLPLPGHSELLDQVKAALGIAERYP